MQMRIRIQPYYQKGFKKEYQNISHALRHTNLILGEKDPSLFELVGKYATILHELKAEESVYSVFRAHRETLSRLYEAVEEKIADWKLADADQALYKIEDIFDDIEKELGRL
jgi:hypothetical protein